VDFADFVPDVTREDVVRVVARDFPDVEQGRALSLLGEYPPETDSGDPARTHLAILKLSGGDIARIRELVAVARQDFRDVIATAEYPEWFAAGFAAVQQMAPEQVDALKARDWSQYQAWLRR
jgi:hypothetical protein